MVNSFVELRLSFQLFAAGKHPCAGGDRFRDEWKERDSLEIMREGLKEIVEEDKGLLKESVLKQ